MRCSSCKYFKEGEKYTLTDYRPVTRHQEGFFSKCISEVEKRTTLYREDNKCTRYPRYIKVSKEHYCGEYKVPEYQNQ